MKQNILWTIFIFIAILAAVITLLALKSKEKVVNFVAVGIPAIGTTFYPDGEKGIIYSYDGKIWHQSTSKRFYSGSVYDGAGVYYGKNKWVATSKNHQTQENILYSFDGINWEAGFRNDGASVFFSNAPDDSGGMNVHYSKEQDMWVAVGQSDNHNNILYSDNGICWDVATFNGSSVIFDDGTGCNGVWYENNRWVAVGKSNNNLNNILYSDNGMSWEPITTDTGISPFISADVYGGRAVTFAVNQWVSLGYNGANNANETFVSDNGISWRLSNGVINGASIFNTGHGGAAIAYNSKENLWVATGDSNNAQNNLIYSNNLTFWEDGVITNGVSKPFENTQDQGQSVVYSPVMDIWLAGGNPPVAEKGGAILYSKDGKNWNTTIMEDGSYPFGTSSESVTHAIGVRF